MTKPKQKKTETIEDIFADSVTMQELHNENVDRAKAFGLVPTPELTRKAELMAKLRAWKGESK